jgi:hypothetical protein
MLTQAIFLTVYEIKGFSNSGTKEQGISPLQYPIKAVICLSGAPYGNYLKTTRY